MKYTTKILITPILLPILVIGFLLVGYSSSQLTDTSAISLSGTDWTLKVDSQLQTVTDSKSVPYVSTTAKGEKELFLTLNSLEDCKLGYIQFKVATTGLTVYKQLPLNEEIQLKEGVYDFVNSTHAMLKGETKVYRPENVVNSFACFDQTGKKVLHIYASQLIDNAGQKVWVDSDLKDELLTVFLDAEFLDTAKFPVILDPTFGYTDIGSSTYTRNTDTIFSNIFTLTENATITSIKVYASSYWNDQNSSIQCAIYDVTDNDPVNLIDTSNTVILEYGDASFNWRTTTISEDLSAGNYALVFRAINFALKVAYDSSGGINDEQTSATFVDPFGTPSYEDNAKCSIYAEYTTEVEPTPTPTPEPTATPTPEPTSTPTPTLTPTEFTSTETWNIVILLVMLIVGLILALKRTLPILNFVFGMFAIAISAWTLTVAPYFGGLLQLAVIIIGVIVMVSGYKEVY